jgi:hypothetical protein
MAHDREDAVRIRGIFLQRRETYITADAALLTNTDEEELLARIETGEIDATVTYRIPWDDVARLAMERWSLEAIYDALGDHADDALPPLLRLERLDIHVPAYVLRILAWIAAAENTTIEHYLRAEFFDLAESIWNLNPEIDHLPGVAAALFFPDEPPRRRKKPRGPHDSGSHAA